MNKISCNIINDILPLYVDEVVSDDTHSMVLEHLEYCENCRKKCDVMKADKFIPIENTTKPLKEFKKVWQRKKVILVCSTIITTMALMCLALFIVNHFAYQEKIAVNGAIYTQKGDSIAVLPSNSIELGYLRGISHKSTSNPTADFMATNLDEKYAGCPIYQSGNNDQIIFLEDYSGFYIPFELSEYIVMSES